MASGTKTGGDKTATAKKKVLAAAPKQAKPKAGGREVKPAKAPKPTAKSPKTSAKPKSKGAGPQRREQQRAIDTRLTIMNAALFEFAEKGFDAASTRDIGQRAGMQHPLITYHYKTKDVLWRSVAEHFISEIREAWDARLPIDSNLSPRDRVREEFKALFEVQMNHPDFHHFMLRESRPGNPRLPWLAQTVLAPMVKRVLPQIEAAQAAGELPAGDPILIHYMLIGMTSVISSLGAELKALTGKDYNTPAAADAYFDLIERVMFDRTFDNDNVRASRSKPAAKAPSKAKAGTPAEPRGAARPKRARKPAV